MAKRNVTHESLKRLCTLLEEVPYVEQHHGLQAKEKVELMLHAIRNSRRPILAALLEANVHKMWDANPREEHITPLAEAVRVRDLKTCKLLLDLGENPNIRSGKLHYTALLYAVDLRNQHCNMVSLLIEYGAIKSITDSNRKRPINLRYAKQSDALIYGSPGYVPANERTLKYMQELTVKERFELALSAMYAPHYDELEMLFKTGLDPNMVHNNKCFLHYALRRDTPDSVMTVKILLQCGCNPNIKVDDRNVLKIFAKQGSSGRPQMQELIDLLVNGGLIKSLRVRNYAVPWFRADEQDSEAYVAANDNTRRYMNELSQADIDEALITACTDGYRDEIQMLIECGASIDTEAPMVAALTRGRDAARILLNAGAKVPELLTGVKRALLQELIDEPASWA